MEFWSEIGNFYIPGGGGGGGGGGDHVGVWGQISGILILWGGGLVDRLGMYIFSEGWFRVGGLGSDISPGVRGQLWGICLYHKGPGLGCFETDIGYVNIVGGWGPEAETGDFNIPHFAQSKSQNCDKVKLG